MAKEPEVLVRCVKCKQRFPEAKTQSYFDMMNPARGIIIYCEKCDPKNHRSPSEAAHA